MRAYHIPLVLVLAGGCLMPTTAGGQEVPSQVASSQGIVFVADGVGHWPAPTGSSGLAAVLRQAGVPMCVERVKWQHGLFRPVRDLVNQRNHREQGAALAARILAYRQENPAGRVVLIGHSGGAIVVLIAAEYLPAGSVDRIILIAPAVSPVYDLGAAFAASREGVDTFNSPRDGVLATFVLTFGTADRKWRPSAGWVGFRSPADDTMTAMLRQHTWHPAEMLHGYFGGHFGPTTRWYLRDSILPLVAPTGLVAETPATTTAVTPDLTGVSTADPAATGDIPAAEWGTPASSRPGLRARIADLLRR